MFILWVLVFHFAWREFINVEFLNFNSTNLNFFLFTLISGGRRYSWGLGWWATSWVPVNQEADFHQILNLLVLWSWTSMSLHGTMSLPAVFAQTHGWRDWRKVLKGEEVPSLLAQLALKAGPRTQKEAGVFVFFPLNSSAAKASSLLLTQAPHIQAPHPPMSSLFLSTHPPVFFQDT